MSEDREPTQTTAAGETIPVPSRREVMDAFLKVSKGAVTEDDADSDSD